MLLLTLPCSFTALYWFYHYLQHRDGLISFYIKLRRYVSGEFPGSTSSIWHSSSLSATDGFPATAFPAASTADRPSHSHRQQYLLTCGWRRPIASKPQPQPIMFWQLSAPGSSITQLCPRQFLSMCRSLPKRRITQACSSCAKHSLRHIGAAQESRRGKS